MTDIAVLLDYTRNLYKEERIEIVNALEDSSIRLLVLYGRRAYPIYENNFIINRNLKKFISLLPDLDGPPEPYRAVKEVTEYMVQYNYIIDDVILIWSAPRKPLVDLKIAFNLVEAAGSRMHLVITRPHSARWLIKIINNLEEKDIIMPYKNQVSAKVVEKLVRELTR